MSSLDEEWNTYLASGDLPISTESLDHLQNLPPVPQPSPLHISTASFRLQASAPIDLNLFWKIPVIPYSRMASGVVKKEMKIISNGEDEYNQVLALCNQHPEVNIHIVSHKSSIKSNGKISITDSRCMEQGLSRKDILMSKRARPKGFINCFILNMRVLLENTFHEFHVKLFNTGQVKVPGAQTPHLFHIVVENLVSLLRVYDPSIDIPMDSKQIVMTNSDFQCNFQINRDEWYRLLVQKYKIKSRYDPCSYYPGVKGSLCIDQASNTILLESNYDYEKYNVVVKKGNKMDEKKKKKKHEEEEDEEDEEEGEGEEDKQPGILIVHFMVFRTGSVLIVGKCESNLLNLVYETIVQWLQADYPNIVLLPRKDDVLVEKRRVRQLPRTMKKKFIQVVV